MKHGIGLALGLLVAGTIAATAGAQETRPDRAIKYRQGVFNAMGWNMYGLLGPMMKGEIPYNKDQAVRAATFLHELSYMPYDGFVAGSDQGAPTKAKPDIWKERAKFDQLAQAMQAETTKLLAAAQSGDQAQFKSAVSATGKACSNCHDDFRNK